MGCGGGGWRKSSVGDEEEIKALPERVLHGLSVWTLKSPREVRERGAEEGREPGTRLTYSEGQGQVVNIGDRNIEDCFCLLNMWIHIYICSTVPSRH